MASSCDRLQKYRKWWAPECMPPRRAPRSTGLKFFTLSLPPLFENRKSTLQYVYCVWDNDGHDIHEVLEESRPRRSAQTSPPPLEESLPRRRRNGFQYFDCFKLCRETVPPEDLMPLSPSHSSGMTTRSPSRTDRSLSPKPNSCDNSIRSPKTSLRALPFIQLVPPSEISTTDVDEIEDCATTPVITGMHRLTNLPSSPSPGLSLRTVETPHSPSSRLIPLSPRVRTSRLLLAAPPPTSPRGLPTPTSPSLAVTPRLDRHHRLQVRMVSSESPVSSSEDCPLTPILPKVSSFSLASTDYSPCSSSPLTPNSESSQQSPLSYIHSSYSPSEPSPISFPSLHPLMDDDLIQGQEVSFLRPILLPKRKKFDEIRVDGKIVMESSREFHAKRTGGGQRDLKEQNQAGGPRRSGISVKENLQKLKDSRGEGPLPPLPPSTNLDL